MNYQEKFEIIQSTYENNVDMMLYFRSIYTLIKEIRHHQDNSHHHLVQTILLCWASELGCAIDGEISEQLLDDLYQKGFISNEELTLFWTNTHFRQG